MNASTHRDTRFEIAAIQQGPNSFGVLATERGVHGSEIARLEIPEGDFTDEEMGQVHAVLGMLEEKFAKVFDAKAVGLTKADVHAMVNESERAKRDAEAARLARLEAEAEASKAHARRAEATAAMDQAEKLRAEALADVEAAVARKAEVEAEIAAAKAAAEQ